MSNTLRHNPDKAPNYKVRRALIAGAGLVGLLAAGNAVNNALDNKVNGHFDKVEQDALQNADSVRNAVVVVREGAAIRTAPKTVNPGEGEGPDTLARRIPEGSVLRIDRPIIHVESTPGGNETRWYGFVQRQAGQGENNSETDQVFWVNASELADQSTAENDYISVYEYDYAKPGEVTWELGVDQQGNFVAGANNMGGAAAVASEMPAEIFDQMVADEHLQPSPGN